MDTTLDTAMDCSEIIDPGFNHSITPLQKMFAACSGALLTSLVTTPFDVVKTRLQSQSISNNNTFLFSNIKPLASTSYSSISSPLPSRCQQSLFFSARNLKQKFFCQLEPNLSSNLCCIVSNATATLPSSAQREVVTKYRQLNGIADGIVKIVRYEGITSLWRGLSPSLVMSVPVTMIYFIGYDHLRDKLWANWKGKYSETYSPLIAGATARTIAVSIISPLELFRTRLQGPEGINGLRGVLNGVQTMVANNGISSLWRGLEPTLWRDVPFSAIYWASYEFIKKSIKNYLHENNLDEKVNNVEITFLSGATSGGFAALVTTPFDVAKTRRQVSLNQLGSNNSMLNVMKMIIQDGGYKELFRGGTLRITKIAVSCALMISTYETLSKMT
ncbi:10167_t:CDS:10 [Entrophospora sp. SA101]|nr:613_t:CDS:10 [Entrophospora sp. SA101]CAJ0747938.1 10167_t:CDS:10 [Entrophospora sp. SA101]CAJ0903196.1 18326_t:CDS:10 [Entrophospora sp. SA101]